VHQLEGLEVIFNDRSHVIHVSHISEEIRELEELCVGGIVKPRFYRDPIIQVVSVRVWGVIDKY
jgi:hypothetical protein